MSRDDFLLAKQRIDDQFLDESWLDFEVHSYSKPQNGSVLVVVASTDFSYYHNLEIHLHEPKYFRGPFKWTASPADSGIIEVWEAEKNAQLIAENRIEGFANAISFANDDGVPIIVSAESMTVCLDTVYYYFRENLNENERLADWVTRPQG